jgi:hypothetical protein
MGHGVQKNGMEMGGLKKKYAKKFYFLCKTQALLKQLIERRLLLISMA